MGGRLVASPCDVTNYAKPMARDDQYLSRTKQTTKHKRQDFLGNNQSTTKRSLQKHDGAGRSRGSWRLYWNQASLISIQLGFLKKTSAFTLETESQATRFDFKTGMSSQKTKKNKKNRYLNVNVIRKVCKKTINITFCVIFFLLCISYCSFSSHLSFEFFSFFWT